MQGQYNRRSPAVKRLMKEAQELHEPTEQYYAQPLEDNLFEWHFTIRGPSDTEFDSGIYHGRIILPPEYPMKPPSIILLTPNGRFEVYKKICLSISGHHPESWQPSWSIRTALLAIIGFMPTHGNGAIGSLDYTSDERKALAKKSTEWKCSDCGSIKNILKPVTEASDATKKEAQELASQINFQGEKEKGSNGGSTSSESASAPSTPSATSESSPSPSASTAPSTSTATATSNAAPTMPGMPPAGMFNTQMMAGNRFPFPMPFMMPPPATTTSASGQAVQTPPMFPMWPPRPQGQMPPGMMWPPQMQAMMARMQVPLGSPSSTATAPTASQPSASSAATSSVSNSATTTTTSTSPSPPPSSSPQPRETPAPTPSTSSQPSNSSGQNVPSSSSVPTSTSTAPSTSSSQAAASSVRQRRGVVTTPVQPQAADLPVLQARRPAQSQGVLTLALMAFIATILLVLILRRLHMMRIIDLSFLF